MDKLIALLLVLCSCAVFLPMERPDGDDMILNDPTAARVQLIGDWNGWGGLEEPGGIIDPLEGAMVFENGAWSGAPPDTLPRGRYRYAFLVNGREIRKDPMNPLEAQYRGNTVSMLIVD